MKTGKLRDKFVMEDFIMKDFFTIGRRQLWICTIISLCVIVVALWYGWMTWGSNEEGAQIAEQGTDTASGQELQADGNQKELEEQSLENEPISASNEDKAASGRVVSGSVKYMLPVEGNVFRQYSISELTYFPTLEQYMTHKGIDILAPEGAEVHAAEEGLVSKILDDRVMGKTVWVAHPGEIVTVYSNLSQELPVEEGDVVKRGEVIGFAGNTSLYEKNDEPHIHVEVLVRGNPVNPSDYFEY